MSANTRESDICAALPTAYAALVSDGRLPAEEVTLTTRPQPRSAICGTNARISRIEAITLRSHWSCQSSSLSSPSGFA